MRISRPHRRLALFMGFSVFFLIALFARTFYVQVIAAPGLQQQAANQQVRSITLDGPRGTIFDRNGEAMAISRSMASVYADPRHIADAAKTAAQLAPILGVSQTDLMKKLTDTSSFQYLARKIDPSVGAMVKNLKLAGIGVLSEPKRVYPKGALAPQLLGFVGGTKYQGMEGLEYEYDGVLSGKPGVTQVVRDLSGNRLSTISTTDAMPGKSITLTIDSEIQFEAEKALSAAVAQFKAKRGSALVMDPRTGEILAMASTPVFSPDDYGSQDPKTGGTRNWAVTDMCEPGSTFKMVTVAAALQNGVASPDTTFTLPNEITAFDKVIHEADTNVPAQRTLTVTQILAQSSNIGAVTLGKEVGKDRLVDMIKKFGFTEKLGIDFPGETAGQLPEKWNGVTIYQVPMGQGVAVSPLQLASAYSAIANDGVLVQPHLVKDALKPWARQVVSPTVAGQLRAMLQVTVEEGTGKKAQLQGYLVAGKTGTAQKPNEHSKGYSNEVIASFIGMVPADSPRLVILVMIDEPQTERLGARVAAPVFARIADFAVKRLGIPPTAGAGFIGTDTTGTDTTATGAAPGGTTGTSATTLDTTGVTDTAPESTTSTDTSAGQLGSE
jgi:cell division protein FtsI (penicillin-binding protein 3)